MRRVLLSFACIVAPVTVALAGTVAGGAHVAADDPSTIEVATTTTDSATTTSTEPATTTTEPATTTTEATTTSTTTSTTTTTTVPAVVPGAPRSLTATPANQSVTLQWAPPLSDGGAAISDYIIERSANGTTGWTPVTEPVSPATTRTLTGLGNGTPVHLRVLAVNAVGTGASSNVAVATPRTVPTAPHTLTATPIAPGQIRLTWLAPTSNGGAPITDYVIERSTNGTSWLPLTDGVNTSRSYTMTGLSTTTRYYFRVAAKNAAGAGPRSTSASAIARVAPSAPRSLTLTPSSGQIRLTWLAPSSNGGAAVTDYVIQRSPNGSTNWTPLADGVNTMTAYTASGLANGTRYYFRVLAVNVVGRSPASNVPSSVPRTVPSAPRSLTALPARSGQVRLSWLAPSSNGGSAINDYVIQRSPTGTGSWTTIADGVSTSTSYMVGGLTNGVRYYFRVVAHNPAGNGPASNMPSATPRTVPSAPTSPRATRGSFSVIVTWGGPTSTGGSPVTRYVLQRSTSSGGPWASVSSSIGPSVRSYTVTGLVYGTRYYFRVSAFNVAGQGSWTTVVNAVPTAPASTCHPSYPTVCIPWNGSDLDCGQIPHRRFAVVTPPAPYGRDPHGFDADRDGVGCESL